jgi:hypothetical protein
MTHAPDPTEAEAWSRRSFLIGSAAVLAAGALAACGGSGDADGDDGDGADGDGGDGGGGASSPTAASANEEAAAATGTFTVVQRFPQGMQVPGAQRLPISLSTGAAELIEDGPETLGATVVDEEGNMVGGALTARRRDVDPAPYYDFRPAVSEAGFYFLVVDGGPADGAGFQVRSPDEVPVPTPGDPLCTRTPDPCPFHDLTLTEALEGDTVVAYYVGTPAFCSTGSCGPALESMIELREEFAETVTFVHAEVYTDTTATEVTEAVEAVGLIYEPALFIADADGVVIERLDAVWNVDELRETLTRAVG